MRNGGQFIDLDATDANGISNLPSLVIGDYDIVAAAWGYKYNIVNQQSFIESEATPSVTIELETGYQDIFSLDLNWETEFNGFQGPWERGVPQGAATMGGFFIAPEFDSPSDPLNDAYMTGNTSDLQSGVLFGEATLRSPSMDLSNYSNPTLSFDSYYWVSDFNGNPVDRPFEIYAFNGMNQVLIKEISPDPNGNIDWVANESINLNGLIELTEDVQIIFRANLPDFNLAMDVAIDNFLVEEAIPSSTEDLITNANIHAFPNPFSDYIKVNIPLVFQNERSVVEVYNTQGKLLKQLKVQNIETVEIGAELSSGVYLISFRSQDKVTKPIKIIKM